MGEATPMVQGKMLRYGLRLLTALGFLPNMQPAWADTKPAWVASTKTENTLNRTTHSLSITGQTQGMKYTVALWCLRIAEEKSPSIGTTFTAELVNGKPFTISNLVWRRALEKSPVALAPLPFPQQPGGGRIVVSADEAGYNSKESMRNGVPLTMSVISLTQDKKIWSEVSDRKGAAFLDSGGKFRDDPLWVAVEYYIPSEKRTGSWETKIDLPSLGGHIDQLAKKCGLM